MDVTLKVLAGTNVGQDLPVAARFLIGRAEDCQLRPKSDLISRHHCVLLVDQDSVAVRDLGSRNGTYVNDERVMGERELRAGDHIKVGPLEFELHVAEKVAVPASKKRPKVTSIKEALARTVEGTGAAAPSESESDVAGWLRDEESSGGPTRELRQSDLPAEPAPEIEDDAATSTDLVSETIAQTQVGAATTENPVKRPGPAPAKGNADSGKAAADVLKQFFRRR